MNNKSNYFLFLISFSLLFLNQKFICQSEYDLQINEDAFHFYVIGDWGRKGHFHQKDLADAMDSIASIIEAEFIATTGDNLYDDGVASIDDPLWINSFENIYDGGYLLMEWRPTLGNHDYRGSAQAQIDYSKKSRRWNMPDYYYHLIEEVDDSTDILFLFIDTNQFISKYMDHPEKYPDLEQFDYKDQVAWMDSILSKSSAKWKFVVGHHPVYTGGKRAGEKSETKEILEPILVKHNVDAYFCGHEHDLQHLMPDNSNVNYIVSGAGSQLRPTGKIDITKFSESIQGFCAVSVTPDSAIFQFIDYKGNTIYSSIIKK